MLLAIDTATHFAGLALYDQAAGWVLGEETWQSVNNHTVELMPRLVRLMDQQRLAPADLSGLVVSLGPGSFTGLRIGLATAKGILAVHDSLDLYTAPSLLAAGWIALQHGGGPVAVLYDAYRSEVFGAVYDLDDFLAPHTPEERIYRLRCVEAWSMVVPWVGIPLGDILKRFEPNSRARYLRFKTLHDPERMPGQRRRVLDWPYEEGLSIAEAMHPLTLMTVGLYGRELPNQNGAPLRLMVPWTYGFKSIKSIVRIRFEEHVPDTTWWKRAPGEYGFYANVNPEVDHPRWSQKYHRIIGAGLFAGKEKTQLFNGYGEEVAGLYAGMDLRKHF